MGGGQLIDFGWLNFPPLNSERENERRRGRKNGAEKEKDRRKRNGNIECNGVGRQQWWWSGKGDANVTAYVVHRGTM